MINLHHVELFYHVARHRGISHAVRNMPYGIQQPAVSSQLLQLEKNLGAPLFQRRPFALTPAGERLWSFVAPFFGNMQEVTGLLRGEATQRLRVAASPMVIREHFPPIFLQMRKEFPGLKLALREANQAQAESLLLNQDVDLAVSVIEEKPASGMRFQRLLDLTMVLLARRDVLPDRIEGFAASLGRHPLIAVPKASVLSRLFQGELDRRGIVWPIQIEVDSLDMVLAYAVRGFGIGLSVQVPTQRFPDSIRSLPLRGFPSMRVGMVWRGRLAPVAESFVQRCREYVKELVADTRPR